jgi:acetylornithine/succinyldiaminopimelate/putrescine aminotransferase
MKRPAIAHARNDVLVGEDGRRYIDLASGHGAAWLGHAHPRIAAGVAEQLERVWITGGPDTTIAAEARRALEGFFPASHAVAGFYSTGMEAAEFAIRLARVVTKRSGVVGFHHGMHGKSLATAILGWDNGDGVRVPGFVRLPFPPVRDEATVLGALEEILRATDVSAVFVEPIQGSGGGWSASPPFQRAVQRLVREAGALLVFDEILTGLHRTGPPFVFSDTGVVPDVVLVGKALGNGFPVSAVVANRAHAVVPAMLPGSTYAGNPLAAAAVTATLAQIRALDMPGLVSAIEQAVITTLGPLAGVGAALRGRGALWVLEPPARVDVDALVTAAFAAGVAVGHAGRYVRVLPAATIEPAHLQQACEQLAGVVRKACGQP